MIRKCLAILSAMLLLVALKVPVANAASDYDEVYATTNRLLLSTDGCTPLDISNNWASTLTDPQSWGDPTSTSTIEHVDSFKAALEHGAWASSQFDLSGSGTLDSVFITWTTTPAYLEWDQDAVYLRSNSSVSSAVLMQDTSSCKPYVILFDLVSGISTKGQSPAFTNFLVAGDVDLNYPTGYEGTPINQTYTPPAPTYVAMGDSFSSGEGNPPFETGSDTSSDSCHRSPQAYPRLLESDANLNLGLTDFVACSGATTNDVINGKNGESSQLDTLSQDTKTVTITIGGNNIKFSDFAQACVYGSCSSSSAEYQESWSIMTDPTQSGYLPTKLNSLFSEIAMHLWTNPDVKIYVIGYPYLMTHASWEDRGVGICSDFDEDEATAAEALVLKLDNVISSAVTDFADSRFVYVDPLVSSSPFLGHELCRGDAYFNGTEAGLGNPAYVFHPNAEGQQAYASLVKSYMS